MISQGQAAVGAGADQRPARLLDARSSTSSLPAIVEFERPAGGAKAIAEAAKLLSEAKFPVILSGAGVVLGNAIPECAALAEKLDAPVCTNYQHNDSFPGSHRLAVGPLGYNGSKAAMELVAKADVVLALGTRLNPFSTLPGYGIDYWPKTAKIIQVDINADRIGLTKPVTVGICGDAKLVAKQILAQLAPSAGNAGREERKALIHTTKSAWLQHAVQHGSRGRRSGHDLERGRAQARRRPHVAAAGLARHPGRPAEGRHHLERHRQQLRDRQRLSDLRTGPEVSGARPVRSVRLWLSRRSSAPRSAIRIRPVVGFAGDGAFGISMSEMSSIGRKEWPGITMVDLPQLPVGCREAQFDPVVRQQLRRHRARPAPELRQGGRGLRPEGRDGEDAGGADGRR